MPPELRPSPSTSSPSASANQTGKPPVVFVHGVWLLPSSWDRWAELFEENDYVALTPGWPDDPDTVEEAKAHPEVFAGKTVGQVADYFETIIYAFANAVGEDEARQLYETYAVPTSGVPMFQATANLNPWTEAKVDTHNPDRGPLLIISGEKDHTVPWAIANGSFKRQQDNEGVTDRGDEGPRPRLTIDSGWREVADTALACVECFTGER